MRTAGAEFTARVFITLLIVAGALNVCCGQSDSKTGLVFKKHTLTNDFISEGVAVGDVNRDGRMDVMAGPYWFEAPAWKRHEIIEGQSFKPGSEYSKSFLNFSLDVNLDGWIDQIVVGFPGTPGMWYENPKNSEGHWNAHVILEAVGIGNESPNFVDVDGDGRKDILCADSNAKQMVWLRAPTTAGSGWVRFPISETNVPGTDKFSHGLGFGDINKDGRRDVIIKAGWWESPSDPKQDKWTFHAGDLGEDCSHMHVLDINGDGRNDVINSAAHKFGIWWHEQTRDEGGNISWTRHEIDKSISQTHSSVLIDLNGDRAPDFITGKRFFAHNDTQTDPGTHDPAVLAWFEFMPGKKPTWKMHEIDNNSGSGLNLVVEDMTKDGLLDIVISNKKGVFLFENQMKKRARK
ncbi:MAG TPA: VCBS repeat-containing protein [Chryseolinea sp.]